MIRKITTGYVIQWFEEDGRFVGQEFVAGDQVEWENDKGEPISSKDWYVSFDMIDSIEEHEDIILG